MVHTENIYQVRRSNLSWYYVTESENEWRTIWDRSVYCKGYVFFSTVNRLKSDNETSDIREESEYFFIY